MQAGLFCLKNADFQAQNIKRKRKSIITSVLVTIVIFFSNAKTKSINSPENQKQTNLETQVFIRAFPDKELQTQKKSFSRIQYNCDGIIPFLINNCFMFCRTAYRFSSLFGRTATASSSSYNPFYWWAKRLTLPTVAMTYYAFIPTTLNKQQEKNWQQDLLKEMTKKAVQQPKPTFWAHLWSGLVHVLRFLQLMIIFTPSFILSPLLFFNATQDFWFQVFVKAIQRSGVVFIKAFQYLSHRRDIIGPQLASKFQYLRQQAPTHSYATTEEYFKKHYGRNVEDIFEEFDPIPIASGSVSQVYRAKYKGKKVAVKVRHPNVDKHIQRDVNLLFFMSYLASFISPAMQIPISETSLKKTLTEQIDFTFQMRNLNKFRQMFKSRRDVDFPSPYAESTKDSVLVEEFIEGVPVTYYQNNKHKLNKVIAKLGSEVLFEMLMKNNFVHADCHGGNIFISTVQRPYNFFTEVWDFLKDVMYIAQFRIKAETQTEERIKQVYLQYCQQQMEVRKLIRTEKQKIIINLLDAGMVVELDQRDKRNFSKFIKSVIQCRGNDCAEMIFSLSNYEGKKIQKGDKFENYHNQLTKCFNRLNTSTYSQLQGMELLWDMMRIIRQNKMKLDGEFATLLTNIIVLEGIGRSLDPNINILKCAFPYFKYIDDDPSQQHYEDSRIQLQ